MRGLIVFFALLAMSCSTTNKNYPYDSKIEEVTGLKIPLGWAPPTDQTVKFFKSTMLPEEFDWRTKGLKPPEEQGECGSCWAFATSSVFQDVVKITTGKEADFSEQYLLSCNQEGWSCNGGFFAHDYHISKGYKGAIDGKRYPYTGKDGSCQHNHSNVDSLVTWKYINNNVEEIKTAIYNYGPVAAAVYVDDNFLQYRSGIFSKCVNQHPNHAIVLVGWGKGYWILKNSWGKDWGEDGYMRIRWDCSNVGFAPNFVTYSQSPKADDVDPTPEPEPGPGPSPEPTPDPEPDPRKACTNEGKYKSQSSKQLIPLKIVNRTRGQIKIYWLDYKGNRKHYYTLNPRRIMKTKTYLKHGWVAVDRYGRCLSLYYPLNWWERDWVVY